MEDATIHIFADGKAKDVEECRCEVNNLDLL
jgi:hypothetical protein